MIIIKNSIKVICVALAFLFVLMLTAVQIPAFATSESPYFSAESFAELSITDGIMLSDEGNATLYFENDRQHGSSTFSLQNERLIANSRVYNLLGMTTYSRAKLIYDLGENVKGKIEVSFSIDLTGCENTLQSANNGQTPEAMITLKNSKGEEEIDIVYEANTLWFDENETGNHLFNNVHRAGSSDIKLVFDFTQGTVTATGTNTEDTFTRTKDLKQGLDLRSIVFNFNGNIKSSSIYADLKFGLDNIVVEQLEKEDGLYRSNEPFANELNLTNGSMKSRVGDATLTFTNDKTNGDGTFLVQNGSLVAKSNVSCDGINKGSAGMTYSDARLVYELGKSLSDKVEVSFLIDLSATTTYLQSAWNDGTPESMITLKNSNGEEEVDIVYGDNTLWADEIAQNNALVNNAHGFGVNHIKLTLDFDAGTAIVTGKNNYGEYTCTVALKQGDDLKSIVFNFNGNLKKAAASAELLFKLDNIAVNQLGDNEVIDELEATFSLKNGAIDVHPAQPLRIKFSAPVEVSTLSNISLVDAGGNNVSYRLETSHDGTDVAIVPWAEFKPLTQYTLSIPANKIAHADDANVTATATSVSFKTGNDTGWYMEENFNNLTYPANTGDVIEDINGGSFGIGSKIRLDDGQAEIVTKNGYLAQAEKEFSNGAGLTLREDGRIDMIEANNKSLIVDGVTNYYIGTLQSIYKINSMTNGRIKVSFDLEMPNESTASDSYFFGINNLSSTGAAGALWYIGYDSSKQFFVRSNNSSESIAFEWTSINGDDVPQSCGRFGKGQYHFEIDANIDTGIATFTIIKDSLYVGSLTTEPAVMNETYNTVAQLIFDVNFSQNLNTEIYNVAKNGVKQMQYILDNVCARGYDSLKATIVNSSGVKVDDDIVLTFPTPMTSERISNNVALMDKDGKTVDFTGSLDADGYTYMLNPNADLAYTNSAYTVEIYATSDWEGTPYDEQILSFTTAPRAADIKKVNAAMYLAGQKNPLSALPAGKEVTTVVTFKNVGEIISSDTVLFIGVYRADGKLLRIFASESNIKPYQSDADLVSVSANVFTPTDLGEGGYIQICAYDENMKPYGEKIILGK